MRNGESTTRRTLLKGTAAALTLTTAARLALPGGAFAQGSGPEVKGAKLGFIALTDAAPLFVAKEKGLFAKYGMPDVEVMKQASWGTTRDNLVLGSEGNGIDGAHILTPMPYLISAGKVTQNNVPTPMYILGRLNLNGQCISVAKEYAPDKVTVDAKSFKAAIERKKASGKTVKAAMTFPASNHDLWIRYWLAAAGIDPDKDMETIVVPPPQMVANMKVGTMDCFCVCEPWHAQLINQGIGYTALTTGELWNNHPEKSFALRAAWVDKYPNAAKALLLAVMEAQQWCDKPENRDELAGIVAKRQWINVPVADVTDRMKGRFDYGDGRVVENSPHIMKFWADNAAYPYQSHDLWFLTEGMRWGKFEPTTDTKALIGKVNREDLWREAAKTLGVSSVPTSTSRGKETMFDGKVFDPADPAAYLASLGIKRIA
ncbi:MULTISPECIES: CmpA/NrtA family ABC transporter substrate-binding protein [Methylobacterium]|uniref:Nitrate/nitrite binding protein NrtA n=3 Tax=Pseudomonadota TaxID=1224 RepID=A0ABQ4SX74_9HYPH|nr:MULTISPECIES: CmpA/NrtA family ABC transporter substrate-binding protein [Methylobacterium]PIU07746.1 MAG: bicarbonate-binding protein [Methylobacterium sp. CG09_land_8_20_14_0_10_71_15]PIU15652.1 MAG: bicarbonate-binding protein [Methylobacterium sp. CG08_land_8_20_14_0_20_71_15]GBU17294.1 ABC transporter nitrate-binding protein [Methylobacterium sp.]GJE06276.1 Nitrate/nitrite binding protein NrtA [Methylobacterium jeotgali]